jgi:hypothetical protein
MRLRVSLRDLPIFFGELFFIDYIPAGIGM